MSKLNAVLVIGPSGSGRTTFAKLLKRVLDVKNHSDKIIFADLPEIILWGKRLHTPIGVSVRQHMHDLRAGFFLPAHVVVPLVQIWLEHARAVNPHLRLVIGSGFPETKDQLDILRSFAKYRLIHIDASKDVCIDSINERRSGKSCFATTYDTDTDSAAVVEQRYFCHHRETKPMLSQLNGSVIAVSRDTTLTERLKTCLLTLRDHDQCPVERVTLETGIQFMDHDNGQTHRLIHEIEKSRASQAIVA